MIYRLAGIVGVSPGPLTLRELTWMAQGSQADAWNRAADLMAWIGNNNPYRSRDFHPREFHPFADEFATAEPRPPRVPITVLKHLFVRDD